MNGLILRITDEGDELPLREGTQALVRDAAGLHLVAEGDDALLRFGLDRRGTWLTVGDAAGSVHVNGRRVRRMALLRAGDAVYVDGVELVLAAAQPSTVPDAMLQAGDMAGEGDLRTVLRAVGGRHHGRSFTLDRPRLVGSAADADIRIDHPGFPERQAQVVLADGQVVLRDLGETPQIQVNGRPVRDAVLQAGDQVVFDSQHRFVLEGAGLAGRTQDALPADMLADDIAVDKARRSWRRWPWLLLAALGIAAALSALLLFGSGR